MITIPAAVKIFIGSAPIDMRKSIDGLMAIVENELQEDACSGHLFVFVSRRCDRVKILTWDKGGFVLLYKRFERGQFKLPHMDPSVMAVQMDATQLAMLLDGIDVGRVRRPQHWKLLDDNHTSPPHCLASVATGRGLLPHQGCYRPEATWQRSALVRSGSL